MGTNDVIDSIDLFESGTQGYHTFRIPALTTTLAGTVLAFCEGRKNARGDTGDIDMLLRAAKMAGRRLLPLNWCGTTARTPAAIPARWSMLARVRFPY